MARPLQGKIEEVEVKHPVYYAPTHFYCECGHILCQEVISVTHFYVKVFCMNQNCSQREVVKQIDLPLVTYKILEARI